jgi:adenine deaminase
MRDVTGVIAPGFEADLALLAPDLVTVKECYVRGNCCYQS